MEMWPKMFIFDDRIIIVQIQVVSASVNDQIHYPGVIEGGKSEYAQNDEFDEQLRKYNT